MNNKNNRLLALDVIRGITLFGVIIVNALTINGPYYLDTVDFAFKLNSMDYIISDFILIFFQEKFYPVFIFLFGLSNHLFIKSLLKKYKSKNIVIKIFIKRMMILAMIGYIHLSLFFWGDVLFVYSLIGLVLGPLVIYIFPILNNNKLLILIFFLIGVSILLSMILENNLERVCNHMSFDRHYIDTVSAINLDKIIEIYQQGSILDIINMNIISNYKLFYYDIFSLYRNYDYLILLDNLNYFLELFILVLIGASIVRINTWYDKAINIRNFNLGLIIGISFILAYIIKNYIYISIILILNTILFYVSLFLALYKYIYQKNWGITILDSFSAIGKMTLTWYLLNSVVMSLILYSYGLGLYGKIGVFNIFMISILYYYSCYKFSKIYLSKYKQGPIESLWRKLSFASYSSTFIKYKNT